MKKFYRTDYLMKDVFNSLDNEKAVEFFLSQFSYDKTSYYESDGTLSENLRRFLAGFCMGARLCAGWTDEHSMDFLFSVKEKVRKLHSVLGNSEESSDFTECA